MDLLAPASPTRRATYARFGPNWFTTVMGTAIVATAGATLPVSHDLLRASAVAVWAIASVLLVVVTVVTGLHHRHHPLTARSWLDHPTMAHFHGAAAMAPMAVGAATLTAGRVVLGGSTALVVALVLWLAGTALGVWTSLSPRIRRARGDGPAEGFWLMAVVPPMVSAALGGLLAAQLGPGGIRVALELASWSCFALAAALSAGPIVAVARRVASGDVLAAAPTLFVVLGPLGQSATAALLLGQLAPDRLGPVALVWAVAASGLGWAWLLVALAVVARARPAFAMTWWAFTFPVGTVVTGTAGLASATGLPTLGVLAVLLYAGLVAAWLLVLVRTVRGVWRTDLLR